MSTEVTTTSDETELPPPIGERDDLDTDLEHGDDKAKPPKIRRLQTKARTDSKTDEDGPDDIDPDRRSRGKVSLPKELQEIRDRENASIRDIAAALGTDGAYKIRVSRNEPQQFRDPTTGRVLQVGGFLRNYQTPVDEEILAANHGGGKFTLQFMNRNKMGSFVHFTQRTVEVVGDPRVDDTFRHPGGAPAPVAPPTNGENPKLVEQAFGVLKEQLDAERNRIAAPVDRHDPGMQAVIKVLENQIAAQNQQMAELRRELADQRVSAARPVEQDPLQKKMFESLLDGDSSRLTMLRENHASEVRQLKEGGIENERRLRDQFERDRMDLKQSHQREIDLMKESHGISLRAAEASFNTSVKVLESDNKRLERENAELRTDNKELRAKKEKGPLEVIKDAAQIKEALGVEDGGDESAMDKAISMLPGAIEAAKQYFRPQAQQQQATSASAGGTELQPTRKVVQDAQGNKFVLDAQGNLKPVKKKPPPPPQPGPNGEPPIPVIPEEQISTIISYLERAFGGNQEPEVVAQSGRSMVPPEVLQAIRDHGVDGFLSKVAKLPGTSPLANQAGRNWMRKVGKELVGE